MSGKETEKSIEVRAMISNQILQSTIDGLKNITRKELSVVEKEGKVIATTEENMIGRQIDAVENFISSPAESQLIQHGGLSEDRQGTFIYATTVSPSARAFLTRKNLTLLR